MICPNCGKEYVGRNCLHCGYCPQLADNNNQYQTPHQQIDVNNQQSMQQQTNNYNQPTEQKKKNNTGKIIIVVIILVIVGRFVLKKTLVLNKLTKDSNVPSSLYKVDTSINITPGEIYNDGIFKVSIKSLEAKSMNYDVNLEVTRIGGDGDYNFEVDESFVNDIKILNMNEYGKLYNMNETKNIELKISYDSLEDYNIKSIASIKLPIKVYEKQTIGLKPYKLVEIKTNKYDQIKQDYNIGKKLYEDDIISVNFIKIIDSGDNKYKYMYLFIKNKTNTNYKIDLEKSQLKINGKPVNTDFNEEIKANLYTPVLILNIPFEGKETNIKKIQGEFEYVNTDIPLSDWITTNKEFTYQLK